MASRRMSVADPIHGLLQFDRGNASHRLLLEVMNCKAFQRLRRIGQQHDVAPPGPHSPSRVNPPPDAQSSTPTI